MSWTMYLRISNAAKIPLLLKRENVSWGYYLDNHRPVAVILPGEDVLACVVAAHGGPEGYTFTVSYGYDANNYIDISYDVPWAESNSWAYGIHGTIFSDMSVNGSIPRDGDDFNKTITISNTSITAVDTANWMSQIEHNISDWYLSELVIPGSHDSATYALNNSSPPVMAGDNDSMDDSTMAEIQKIGGVIDRVAEGLSAVTDLFLTAMLDHSSGLSAEKFGYQFVRDYAIAQERNIYEQLNAGARYIDMRIVGFMPAATDTNGKPTFLGCHAIVGPLLEDMLNDVKRFSDEHPQEIILLDFNHLYMRPHGQNNIQKDIPDTFHKALMDAIKQVIGDMMITRMAGEPQDKVGRTLGELWTDIDNDLHAERPCRNIIVFYDNAETATAEKIWQSNKIGQCYPNTTTAAQSIHYITNPGNFIADRPLGQLYVTQLQCNFPTDKNQILLFVAGIIANLGTALESLHPEDWYLTAPLSLADMDRASTPIILSWLSQWENKTKANITLIDRVTPDICRQLILINQAAFGTRRHDIPPIHFFTNPKAGKNVPPRILTYSIEDNKVVEDKLIVHETGRFTGISQALTANGRFLYFIAGREKLATEQSLTYNPAYLHLINLGAVEQSDTKGGDSPSPGYMQLSKDGKYLVLPGSTGGATVEALLFDAKTLKQVDAGREGMMSMIDCCGLDIDPNMTLLRMVAANADFRYFYMEASIMPADVKTNGKISFVSLKRLALNSRPTCLASTPNGNEAFVFLDSQPGGPLNIFTIQSGSSQNGYVFTADETTLRPNTAVFFANGKRILLTKTSQTEKSKLCVFSLNDRVLKEVYTFPCPVLSMVISPDGDTLVTIQNTSDGKTKMVSYNLNALLNGQAQVSAAELPDDSDREVPLNSLIAQRPSVYYKIIDPRSELLLTAVTSQIDSKLVDLTLTAGDQSGMTNWELTDNQCWYLEKISGTQCRLLNKAYDGVLNCIYNTGIGPDSFYFSEWNISNLQTFEKTPDRDNNYNEKSCFYLVNTFEDAMLCSRGGKVSLESDEDIEANDWPCLFYIKQAL